METSTNFLMIRKDGNYIKALTTKFEKKVGDKIEYDKQVFYVFQLSPSLFAACSYLKVYSFSTLRSIAERALTPLHIRFNESLT